MGYSSKGGKPFELASKSSHHHVINDPDVQSVLRQLDFPPSTDSLDIEGQLCEYIPDLNSPVENVIAIDGGYTEAEVRPGFPSALVHFFQFGALFFKREDLRKLDRSPHIAPEDMAMLNKIQRLKFVLPSKGVRREGLKSLKDTVRLAIHEFFYNKTMEERYSLLDTLKWFVFQRYRGSDGNSAARRSYVLSSHPVVPEAGRLTLYEDEMQRDGTFTCPITGELIYLTDIFRFHEIIDEEKGATGVCGYLAGVIEHMMAVHVIRLLVDDAPDALRKTIFIMDRPTGFFGQTALLHKQMSSLVNWLLDKHQIYWVGIEKSGAFVDHAAQIRQLMPNGTFLILGDKHIYRYISTTEEDPKNPYASTSYYGHKIIFKTPNGQMYVISIPVRKLSKEPTVSDIPNIQTILTHIAELRCDMYDSALIPIALVNKLVSLSAHPSSEILKSFAKSTIG